MTAFFSEALGKHDRSAFTSGNERIDAYSRQTVSQDVKRGYAARCVLVEKASGKLAGFYTLSSHSIALTELAPELARKLPRYPSVPADELTAQDLLTRFESRGERAPRARAATRDGRGVRETRALSRARISGLPHVRQRTRTSPFICCA